MEITADALVADHGRVLSGLGVCVLKEARSGGEPAETD